MSDSASPRTAALVGLAAWPADSSLLQPPDQTYLPGYPLLGREGVQLLYLATTQRMHPDSHFLVAQSLSCRLFVLPFPLSFGPPSWNHSPPFLAMSPRR